MFRVLSLWIGVGLLLICGVVSFVYTKEQSNRVFWIARVHRITSNVGDLPTEGGDVFWAVFKDIVVSKQTPKIKIFSAITNCDKVGGFYDNKTTQDATFRADLKWTPFVRQPEPRLKV